MDSSSLELENVGNSGIAEEPLTLDGLRSSLPNGVPVFSDGALHQFLVLTNANAPVSLIARENLVYELFFQLMRPDQLLTGAYNQFVYTNATESEGTVSNEAANSAAVHCRLEQSGTLCLPIVRDSFQRLLTRQQATGVEQLPNFDNARAVHCLRINAPPCCAALNDTQSIKSMFDMLNIVRFEPSGNEDGTPDFASEARLEMTFRVSKLATAQMTAKPLEISYSVYTYDELSSGDAVASDNPLALLTFAKHAVCFDQRATLIPTQVNEAPTPESEVFRRVESLYRRVQLPDDARSTMTLVECPTCHIQFFGVTEYVQHTLVTHDDRRCVLCDAEMATYEHLVEHHLPQCIAYAHRAAMLRVDASQPEDIYARIKADLERFFDAPTQACDASASTSTSLRPGDVNGNVSETIASSSASFSAFERGGAAGDMVDNAAEMQPELIAVQRGRGPIQIYGDFSCKFCGRLCKTYIGLKSHVTQGHREFYNKLLLHTLEKVKEIQLEQVRADSAEAQRLRMLDFDAAWSTRAETETDPEVELDVNGNGKRRTRTLHDNASTSQWESASHAFFHALTVEMLQMAFERVLRELENGVGLLNDEVRLEQMRSRMGGSGFARESMIGANKMLDYASASVIEWRSSVNGEIKRIDERNKRSAAFVAYRKRIQQTTELIKMMERASLGDSNKRGLWNVLDVERLFHYVSGEQVQAVSKLPSRYARGKRPRGRPPKASTLGLPEDATAEEIKEAQLILQDRRMLASKKLCTSPNAVCRESSSSINHANVLAQSLSRRNSMQSAAENRLSLKVDANESDDAFLEHCDMENGQILCAICGAHCDNREKLLEHRRLMHLNKVIFVCDSDGCHKCFSSLMLLSEHRNVHAVSQPSASMHSMNKQREQNCVTESESKLHVCSFCSLSFSNDVFLRMHHKQVHKNSKSNSILHDASSSNDYRNDADYLEPNEEDGNHNTQLHSHVLNSLQQVRVISAKNNAATTKPHVITPANQQDAARPKGIVVNVLDATCKPRRSQVPITERNISNFSTPPKHNTVLPAKQHVDSTVAGQTQATAGNSEVVYRCGLCEILFANLAEVIAHQREFQGAQTRDKRLQELGELRTREEELLVYESQNGLKQKQREELTVTREQLSALEQELSGAQVARYFCSICRNVFTSECVANQHAREVHTTTRRSPENLSKVAQIDDTQGSQALATAADSTLPDDAGVPVAVE